MENDDLLRPILAVHPDNPARKLAIPLAQAIGELRKALHSVAATVSSEQVQRSNLANQVDRLERAIAPKEPARLDSWAHEAHEPAKADATGWLEATGMVASVTRLDEAMEQARAKARLEAAALDAETADMARRMREQRAAFDAELAELGKRTQEKMDAMLAQRQADDDKAQALIVRAAQRGANIIDTDMVTDRPNWLEVNLGAPMLYLSGRFTADELRAILRFAP